MIYMVLWILNYRCYANITDYTILKQTQYLRLCKNRGFTFVGEDIYPFREGLFVGFYLLRFTISLHTKSEISANHESFAWFKVKFRNILCVLSSFQKKMANLFPDRYLEK